MAARIPAPPAPTMTVSYLWICIGVASLSSPGLADVRVEGEDHQRTEHDGERRRGEEQRLEPEPGVRLLGVVVDDGPQAVAAVQHGQPQHHQVPALPERRGPAARDEREADLGDTAVQDEL